MNNKLIRYPGILPFLFFPLILISAWNSEAQPNRPVSVALEKQTVSLGEPVLIQIHVKNTSSVPLELDLGLNGKDNIFIVVTQPDGKRIEKPQPVPRNGVAFFGWQRLESGQEYSEALVLNEWFEFKQVGRYLIQVQLREPATIGAEKIAAGLFVLNLDVTPSNTEELLGTCKDLLARARHHQSAQDNIAAESALRYIDDPAMLQFWMERSADKSPTIREIAFSNMARIGSVDAVEALSRVMHSQDKDIRSLARSALEQITRITADVDVRTRAEQALRQH